MKLNKLHYCYGIIILILVFFIGFSWNLNYFKDKTYFNLARANGAWCDESGLPNCSSDSSCSDGQFCNGFGYCCDLGCGGGRSGQFTIACHHACVIPCGSSDTCSTCAPSGPVCGNGSCESGENGGNCPADCPTHYECQGNLCANVSGAGTNTCGSGVSCGGGNSVCGNSVCEIGEDCGSCSADCGSCPSTSVGVCGSDNGKSLATLNISDSNLCAAGTLANFAGSGPWTWTCNGSGGNNSSCSAEVNSNCGSDAGFGDGSPSSNLCQTGSPSSVSGSGPWTWTCNGGTTASCTRTPNNYSACTSINTNKTNYSPGEAFTATVTMRNMGSTLWYPGGAQPHRLGSWDPTDNTYWDTNRISLPTVPAYRYFRVVADFGFTTASNYGYREAQFYDGSGTLLVPSACRTYQGYWQHPCADASDGNVGTYWGVGNNGFGMNYSYGVVVFDLGSAKTISQIKLLPFAGVPFTSKVWASNDANTWTDIGNNINSITGWVDFAKFPAATDNVWQTSAPGFAPYSQSGQDITFSFSGHVNPPTNGSVPFSWKMVQDGVAWFGQICTTNINVVTPPAISLSSLTNISAVAGAAAPASQALTITNTGGSVLNWRATSTTPSICTLSKLTGTAVANNGTDSLGVIFASPVASMVSTSPNNCSITVSDQGGVAASKQASNTYTVTVGPPGGGGAGSVTAAQAICPTMGVVINWSAGPGATSYQIYRKRHGTIGTSVIATVGNVLTYTDTTGTNGTYYDYFVQSVGNATQVAASSNSGIGVTPNTCSGGSGPGTVTSGNGTCGQISLSWGAVAAATGYNVYRGPNTTFASSTKIASNKPLATPGSPYVDTTVTGGSVYYYFVTGIVSGLETTSTVSSGASTNTCTANMSNSDKIITAVNGVVVANVPALGSCGNSTINLPANTALNLGDKLSFRIDLCNTTNNSDADATNIYVTDTFTNLATSSLVTSFNAKLYTNVGTTVVLTYDNGCSGTSAPAQNNHYCVYGTAPNQTLKFNLSDSSNNLPAHTGYAALTFDAALSVAPNTNGVSSRFYNNYNISYTGPTSPSGTISWPFYLGNQVPIIHEVP